MEFNKDLNDKIWESIVRNIGDFITIEIPDYKVQRLYSFASAIGLAKQREHKIDNKREVERNFTGFLGELAIEQYLGIEFIDWTIGKSEEHNSADLSKLKLNIGIKTSEIGNVALIPKKPYREEVVTIMISDHQIKLCGLATKEIQLQYSSPELVKDPAARDHKVGFWGYSYLEPIEKLKERYLERQQQLRSSYELLMGIR